MKIIQPDSLRSSCRVKLLIQARLSSQRLPAKALLTIGGIPSIILSARRIMRSGLPVTVATSLDDDDDLIENCCSRAGVPVTRGPRDDVLGRFHAATSDLDDSDLCVRLTGDNVFPDHEFVAELLAIRESLGCTYLAYGSRSNEGLPYGLSAEVFTVAALRDAHKLARDREEREHVTPLIAARHNPNFKPPFPGAKKAYDGLRCTIDNYQDYQRIARLFLGFSDPVSEPWNSLADTLSQ